MNAKADIETQIEEFTTEIQRKYIEGQQLAKTDLVNLAIDPTETVIISCHGMIDGNYGFVIPPNTNILTYNKLLQPFSKFNEGIIIGAYQKHKLLPKIIQNKLHIYKENDIFLDMKLSFNFDVVMSKHGTVTRGITNHKSSTGIYLLNDLDELPLETFVFEKYVKNTDLNNEYSYNHLWTHGEKFKDNFEPEVYKRFIMYLIGKKNIILSELIQMISELTKGKIKNFIVLSCRDTEPHIKYPLSRVNSRNSNNEELEALDLDELMKTSLPLSTQYTVTAPFLKAENYKKAGKLPPPYTQIPFGEILKKNEDLQDTYVFGKTKKKNKKKSKTKHKKQKSRKKKRKRKKRNGKKKILIR